MNGQCVTYCSAEARLLSAMDANKISRATPLTRAQGEDLVGAIAVYPAESASILFSHMRPVTIGIAAVVRTTFAPAAAPVVQGTDPYMLQVPTPSSYAGTPVFLIRRLADPEGGPGPSS